MPSLAGGSLRQHGLLRQIAVWNRLFRQKKRALLEYLRQGIQTLSPAKERRRKGGFAYKFVPYVGGKKPYVALLAEAEAPDRVYGTIFMTNVAPLFLGNPGEIWAELKRQFETVEGQETSDHVRVRLRSEKEVQKWLRLVQDKLPALLPSSSARGTVI